MNTRILAATLAVASFVSPALAADGHGIDIASIDNAVKPCEDFFMHAAGGWIKANPIPGDYSRWGVWNSIEKKNFEVLKTICEEAAKNGAKGTKAEQLAGAFWASGMDTARVEAEGANALKGELAKISAIKDVPGLIDAIARNHRLGVTAMFAFGSTQDYKDSSQVIGAANQGGLGLPEREYYLKEEDESKKLRDQYVAYIVTLLTMVGEEKAAAEESAAKILALETRFAKASLTNVERRDPVKTYNKKSIEEMAKLTPGFDWKRYLVAAGKEDVASVNVEAPLFMQALDKTLAEVPLDTWRPYLKFHLVDAMAPFLSDKFVDAHFAFRGKILTGKKELLPRWKRVINASSQLIGEAVGEAYVKKMFTPEAKAKALAMVMKMKETLKGELEKMEWMSPETRKRAVSKLQAFNQKIGYPDKWRDYSTLDLTPESYATNVLRAREFEAQRDLNKIGKPVDKNEWYMPPQMINAYYDPSNNEIAFPAAILQPPLFDAEAGEEKNLGGIGAIIGHEMGHGFDDQGAQFDEKGNLSNWWSPEDLKKFQERTDCIAKQFDAYGIDGGLMTKGKLVVGEAVGDFCGLTLAYRTMLRGIQGDPAAKDANGHTVHQRFFYAFAQGWAQHSRPEQEKLLIKTDPHPLARFRVNGTVTNMPEFLEAFGCKDGKLVRKAGEACRIW